MNRDVIPDPFWDRSSGNVRCSSTGIDATQYHDPSTVALEGSGGRSLASLMPSGLGLRGVVIPRATALGGSRGFDPHKPKLVNIDPDIKGQACVIDMSKLTKEAVQQAYEEAAANPLAASDPRLLAAQTYHNLAVGYEPVGIGPSTSKGLPPRKSPFGEGGYVVPKAKPGGGQERHSQQYDNEQEQSLMSPSVSPRTVKQTLPKPKVVEVMEEEYEEQEEPKPMHIKQGKKSLIPKSSPPVAKQPQTVNAPATRVTFEMEGWGTFEANYHKVIENDCLLVLVYDNRYKGGVKFFPQAYDKLLAVRVGNADSVYFVNSYGARFIHDSYEYCILIIAQQSNIDVEDESEEQAELSWS